MNDTELINAGATFAGSIPALGVVLYFLQQRIGSLEQKVDATRDMLLNHIIATQPKNPPVGPTSSLPAPS